jgi:hypothetical protein
MIKQVSNFLESENLIEGEGYVIRCLISEVYLIQYTSRNLTVISCSGDCRRDLCSGSTVTNWYSSALFNRRRRVLSSDIWRRVVCWKPTRSRSLRNHRCENLKSYIIRDGLWQCTCTYEYVISVCKLYRSHALVVFTYLYRWLEIVPSEEWGRNLFHWFRWEMREPGEGIKGTKESRRGSEGQDTKEIIPVSM